MKISYNKGYTKGESHTVNQWIRMTEREFEGFNERIMSEVSKGLPRRMEYIFTSGYDIFMKNLDIFVNGKCFFANLNNTQLRFLKLFYKDNKRIKIDRNTVVFYYIA